MWINKRQNKTINHKWRHLFKKIFKSDAPHQNISSYAKIFADISLFPIIAILIKYISAAYTDDSNDSTW